MEENRKSLAVGWKKLGLVSILVIAALFVFLYIKREPPVYPPLTAGQERNVFIATLKASGEAPPALRQVLVEKTKMLWDAAFAIGEDQLSRHDRQKELLDVGTIECFQGGCMRNLRFKSHAAAGLFEQNLIVGPASPLRRWPGRIYRGPLVDEKAQGITAVWALLVDRQHHDQVEAMSDVPSAGIVPISPASNRAISDLRQGEQ